MDRRTFLTAGAAALAAPAAGCGWQQAPGPAAPVKPSGKFLAQLGMQDYATDDFLHMYSAFGVNHICSALPSKTLDEKWSVEGLMKERERVESFGLHLDMLPLPLSSVEIDKADYPAIMLGKVPERDRAIDDICQMIRNASQAGIPGLKYNMSILGIVRTEPVKGRGSSIAKSFVYDQAKQEPPLTARWARDRGDELGADHLLREARDSRRRGVQGQDARAPARPRHAEGERIPRRRARARAASTGSSVSSKSSRALITGSTSASARWLRCSRIRPPRSST